LCRTVISRSIWTQCTLRQDSLKRPPAFSDLLTQLKTSDDKRRVSDKFRTDPKATQQAEIRLANDELAFKEKSRLQTIEKSTQRDLPIPNDSRGLEACLCFPRLSSAADVPDQRFTDCTSYLKAVLRWYLDNRLEITLDDWDFLLEEVTETLPQGSAIKQEQVIRPQHDLRLGYVTEKNRYNFAFLVCHKVGATDPCLMLWRHLVERSGKEVTEQHKSAFLSAVASNSEQDAEEEALLNGHGPIRLQWEKQILTESQSRVVVKICHEILQEQPNSTLIPDIIGALSHTSSHWLEAFELWDRIKDDDDFADFSWFHSNVVDLARSLLYHSTEEPQNLDKFFNVIRHRCFHKDHNYLRYKPHVNDLWVQAVYVDYIDHCRRNCIHPDRADDLYGMKRLFEALSDAFYCGNGAVERQIKSFFEDSVPKELGSDSTWVVKNAEPKRRTIDAVNRSIHNGFCPMCTQQAVRRRITNDESQELFESVLDQLQSRKSGTEKSELDMFFSVLDDGTDYDVVLDGWNIAMNHEPGQGGTSRRRIGNFGTKTEQKNKKLSHDEKMRYCLSSAIDSLRACEMKPLIVGTNSLRPYLPKDVYKKARLVMVNKITPDDPFIILSALKPFKDSRDNQNFRMFVSNDTFSDHWYNIPSARLKNMFTRWQVYHQIKANLIVNSLIPKEKPRRRLYIQFPRNEDLTATEYESGWHIPLDTSRTNGFKKMYLPQSYLCISHVDTKEIRLKSKLGRFQALDDD